MKVFDLPAHKSQSTHGARAAYHAMWQRDWPHDDEYLRALAKRVADETRNGSKCITLLNAMREQHEF